MKPLTPPPPGPILGIYPLDDAAAYYRCMVPLSVVPGATWVSLKDLTQAHLDAAQTVVWMRPGGRRTDVRAFLNDLRRRWGIERILIDFDDAMFEQHPVREVRPHPAALEGVREALAQADGVIVQNAALQRYYAAHTTAPIAVVPNLVRLKTWPETPPRPTWPPTIVLAGSPSHGKDWEIVTPALTALRQQVPDVRLRLIGCAPHGLRPIATELIPWAGPWEYPRLLQGGAIGLCPLPENLFNICKSPIKAFEYSLMAGMAVIGSLTQYAPILADQRGILVDDGDPWGWARALDAYLCDPQRRAADAARLRAYVRKQYDVTAHAARLEEIYYGLSRRSRWPVDDRAVERADHDRLRDAIQHRHADRDDGARAVDRQ